MRKAPPIKLADAVKLVNRLREDAMWSAMQLQNQPEKIAKALANDKDSRKEIQQLVSDLFSLLEVVVNEPDPQPNPADLRKE